MHGAGWTADPRNSGNHGVADRWDGKAAAAKSTPAATVLKEEDKELVFPDQYTEKEKKYWDPKKYPNNFKFVIQKGQPNAERYKGGITGIWCEHCRTEFITDQRCSTELFGRLCNVCNKQFPA